MTRRRFPSIEAELADPLELSLPTLRAAAELVLDEDDPLSVALAHGWDSVQDRIRLHRATDELMRRPGGQWRRIAIAYGVERIRQFAALARPAAGRA
jgi:hypothetical protein